MQQVISVPAEEGATGSFTAYFSAADFASGSAQDSVHGVSQKGSSSLPPADLTQDSRAHGCYRIIVGLRPGSAGEAPSRLTHNEEGDSGCNFLPGFNSWVVISPGCSPHLVPPLILDTPAHGKDSEYWVFSALIFRATNAGWEGL